MSEILNLTESFFISWFENADTDPVTPSNLSDLCRELSELEEVGDRFPIEFLEELGNNPQLIDIIEANAENVVFFGGNKIIAFEYGDRYSVNRLNIWRYGKNNTPTHSITILNNRGNILLTIEEHSN